MTTRKLPSGAKHARCIDHVPHSYTTSGWLCVSTRDPGRGAEMVAFADHLASVMSGRQALRLAELAIPATGQVAGNRTDGRTKYNTSHGMGGSPITRTAEEREAFARLSAQLNELKGRPAPVPASPVRRVRAVKRPSPIVANLAPADDTYATAVAIAETRPDPCAECGHPAHGATCVTCGPAECRLAEPAPALSAPNARPTCPRCGQLFRKSGTGLAWHLANRLDCAPVAVTV